MLSDSGSRFTEAKVDATVILGVDEPGKIRPIGDPIPALIHLIEFQVDKDFVAWFGVAEISCDITEVTKQATVAGMKAVPDGWTRDLMDFRMQITLEDGRRGTTTISKSEGDYRSTEYHRVEFTGLSKLTIPIIGK